MDDTTLGGPEGTRQVMAPEAERLVIATIAAHANSLLRTARRHSLCVDDAHDAYQRGLEIFLRHAARLDPERASRWLHTVVKHEAMAVRRTRQQLVAADEVDLDAHEARHVATPEEQVLEGDEVARSAEALQRLKPQEVRALWLQMQGLSYREIERETGWSYTKVNRCLTEGRRAFLRRFAGIQAGEECGRWSLALSAMADGEASAEQVAELRPHLRNCAGCRMTLRALTESRPALQAVLPVPLVIAGADGRDAGEAVAGLLTRCYETVVGAVQERVALVAVKAQLLMDMSVATKATAAAATAVALGGGVAGVERAAEHRSARAAQQAALVHRAAGPGRPPTAPVQPGRPRTAPGSQPGVVGDGQSRRTAGSAASPTAPRSRRPAHRGVSAGKAPGPRVMRVEPTTIASEQEFSAEATRSSVPTTEAMPSPPPAVSAPRSPEPSAAAAGDQGEFGFEQ
jgi:RNA polymerase sigma factor (sigma-70 family)